MRKFRIVVFVAMLAAIAATLLGGCIFGGSGLAATPNSTGVSLTEAPAFPDFSPEKSGDLAQFSAKVAEWRTKVAEWRTEVRAQAQNLDSAAAEALVAAKKAAAKAEQSAVAKATEQAADARREADASAKTEALVAAKKAATNATSLEDIRAGVDQAKATRDATLVANAKAEQSAVAKATEQAADARHKTDAKARGDYRETKAAIAAELDRATALADSDVNAADRLFGNDAEQSQQVDALTERVAGLEAAPLAAPAVPCPAQPDFAG